jgi:hypothetical protein
MLPESTGRNEEVYKALATINAFASIGVQRCDVTLTDIDGKKLEKVGFFGNRSMNELRRSIASLIREATAHQHNVILRPHHPPCFPHPA